MAMVEQRALSISDFASRYGVSPDTIRRAAEAGYLRTIYILGRRLVPVTEIDRVEREGLGAGRKRGWSRTAAKAS